LKEVLEMSRIEKAFFILKADMQGIISVRFLHYFLKGLDLRKGKLTKLMMT